MPFLVSTSVQQGPHLGICCPQTVDSDRSTVKIISKLLNLLVRREGLEPPTKPL